MPSDEANHILEQLNQAQVSQRQWNVASADGVSAAMLASANAQLQRMQDQQSAQLNAQLSQQQYLRAYSQAMPGVPSPTQIYTDPTVSNYALQNMYQMNPYMANFFGQSQGAPSMMGMPPPSFMTSPRMGLFRGTRYNQQGRPVAEHGLISDVAALMRRDQNMNYFNPVNWFSLGMQRTFAPHEDPIDEVIEAKRRMYRRSESLTGALIMGADVVGGLALGGAAGLGLGMATVPLGMAASAYFQRRAETSQIQDISRGISTGASAGGYRNLGFSGGESARMMQGMRRDAAASPFYSMSDMTQMFEQSTQNNLFSFTGNAQQTTENFKKIVASIDTFMRLAGDPDVQSAMQRMSSLQTMGASIPQMTHVVANIRGLATLAGTSVDQMMQTTGAYGAQVASQMGQSPLFGMMAGGTAQAATRSMVQRGVLSPTQLAIRGGEEGVTQSLTQILTNTIGTAVEQRFAGMTPGGGYANLMDSFRAIGNMSPEALREYQRTLKDKSAEYLKDMTPADQISYMRNYVKEIQGYYGNSLSRRDILRSKFGELADPMDDMLGVGFARDRLSKSAYTSQINSASEHEKFIQKNTLAGRIGTWLGQAYNTFGESLGDYEEMSQMEQEDSLRAAGVPIPRGFSGFSGTDEQAAAFERVASQATRTTKLNRNQVVRQALQDKGSVGALIRKRVKNTRLIHEGYTNPWGPDSIHGVTSSWEDELRSSTITPEETLNGVEKASRLYSDVASNKELLVQARLTPIRDREKLVNSLYLKQSETFNEQAMATSSPEEMAQFIVEMERLKTQQQTPQGITKEEGKKVLAADSLQKALRDVGVAESGVTLTQAADNIKTRMTELFGGIKGESSGDSGHFGLRERNLKALGMTTGVKQENTAEALKILADIQLGTESKKDRERAAELGIVGDLDSLYDKDTADQILDKSFGSQAIFDKSTNEHRLPTADEVKSHTENKRSSMVGYMVDLGVQGSTQKREMGNQLLRASRSAATSLFNSKEGRESLVKDIKVYEDAVAEGDQDKVNAAKKTLEGKNEARSQEAGAIDALAGRGADRQTQLAAAQFRETQKMNELLTKISNSPGIVKP